MKLSDFSIKHPAIIGIILVAVVAFSIISFINMPVAFLPDVARPSFLITTQYPGASAATVDKEVSKIIEGTLSSLADVDTIEIDSRDNISIIKLILNEDANVEAKLPEVRERLNLVQNKLPENISSQPAIRQMTSAEGAPILSFTVSGPGSLEDTSIWIEDVLSPALVTVPGISNVKTYGASLQELRIDLNMPLLEVMGISALAIQQAIQSADMSLPAGTGLYQGSELPLTAEGGFDSIRELENLIIGAYRGETITLGKVADIYFDYPDSRNIVLDRTGESVYVKVFRKTGINALTAIADAKVEIDKLTAAYPYKIGIIQDDSVVTGNSVNTIMSSLLLGVGLAILVIFFFLGDIRSTLFIAISLPLSILFSFIGMQLTGMTVNLLSLSGITVAIGMVVDASIVVMENISRYLDKGKNRFEASSTGAGEMAAPVLASTMTTLAVFAPLVFLTGVMGIFFSNISYTLIFSLTASLIISVMVVPFLTSKFAKHMKKREKPRLADRLFSKLEHAYSRALIGALKNKKFIVLFAFSVLVISGFSLRSTGMTFLPTIDSAEIEVNMSLPRGINKETVLEKTRQLRQIVLDTVPEAQNMYFEIDNNTTKGLIQLSQPSERERHIDDINKMLFKQANESITDAEISFFNGGINGLLALTMGGRGYGISLSGQDFTELSAVAKSIQNILEQDPEIYKAELSANLDSGALNLYIDEERAGLYGVSTGEAAALTRMQFNGTTVGTYESNDSDRDIILTIPRDMRNLNDNYRMFVTNRAGSVIRFESFSELTYTDSADTISRKDRSYNITIDGLYHGDDPSGIDARIRHALSQLDFPEGVDWEVSGSAGKMAGSLGDIFLVLGIAIFLVYTVMVIQFERFLQPLIVMSAFPFSIIGVVFGLNLFGSIMTIIGFLGVIALAGVVVNNAIVMIDYFNFLRNEKNQMLDEAIVNGAASRLRPILMTTLTTVLGIIPMALGRGNGAEFYAPLGQVIFGGLITSSFISLFLIPVLYKGLETVMAKRKSKIDSTMEELPGAADA